MLAQHQLVPHAHQIESVNANQPQPTKVCEHPGHVHRQINGLPQPPRLRGRTVPAHGRRQNKVPGSLQLTQRLGATCNLAAPSGIEEAEVMTNRLGNRGSALMPPARQQLSDDLDRGLLSQRSLDLVLLIHAEP